VEVVGLLSPKSIYGTSCKLKLFLVYCHVTTSVAAPLLLVVCRHYTSYILSYEDNRQHLYTVYKISVTL